ncbi:MAG: LemA family protein, partial [Novosphingobium sp.]
FGRLLANTEAYPELKGITNYQMLQSQLEGQENRIRIAIKDYNEAVRAYNTTIRTFPDAIGAKVIYGAKPMVPYEAVTPGANVAPSLDGKV